MGVFPPFNLYAFNYQVPDFTDPKQKSAYIAKHPQQYQLQSHIIRHITSYPVTLSFPRVRLRNNQIKHKFILTVLFII